MSTSGLYNPEVQKRKTDFLKFLKGCKEEEFTKKEAVKTARLNAEKVRIAREEEEEKVRIAREEEELEEKTKLDIITKILDKKNELNLKNEDLTEEELKKLNIKDLRKLLEIIIDPSINKDNEKSDENKIVKKDNVNVIPSPPTPKQTESEVDKLEQEIEQYCDSTENNCTVIKQNRKQFLLKTHPDKTMYLSKEEKKKRDGLLTKVTDCSKKKLEENKCNEEEKKDDEGDKTDGKGDESSLTIYQKKSDDEERRNVLEKGQNLLAGLRQDPNIKNKKPTSPLLSQQLIKRRNQPPPPILQLEISKKKHDQQIKKKTDDYIKSLEDIKKDDKKALELAEQEYKNELKNLTDKHRLELEKINKEAKEREEELEQKIKKAENSKQDEEITKEEIERLRKLIVQNNLIQKKAEQQTKQLEETRTENQKAVIEMRKKEEEEKRKQKEEFLKHKGESLEKAIKSLKDKDGNFTNMSEIKIEALENYPTLNKKIKNFLVFKEDELIKAHHAKFYSDNIKRNNEKLVETLKLVPSEPFLGIEGLPLVSGFGSEVKEEEIESLKEIREKVRKFIQDRAQYIFNPSQHEQLSVKEYLKNL